MYDHLLCDPPVVLLEDEAVRKGRALVGHFVVYTVHMPCSRPGGLALVLTTLSLVIV